MRWSTLGLIAGFAAGLVLVIEGIWAFLLVLLCAGAGLAVGKYADGDLDVSRYVGSGRGNVRSWRRPRRGA
jgi:uncharacterized membrane protein